MKSASWMESANNVIAVSVTILAESRSVRVKWILFYVGI